MTYSLEFRAGSICFLRDSGSRSLSCAVPAGMKALCSKKSAVRVVRSTCTSQISHAQHAAVQHVHILHSILIHLLPRCVQKHVACMRSASWDGILKAVSCAIGQQRLHIICSPLILSGIGHTACITTRYLCLRESGSRPLSLAAPVALKALYSTISALWMVRSTCLAHAHFTSADSRYASSSIFERYRHRTTRLRGSAAVIATGVRWIRATS